MDKQKIIVGLDIGTTKICVMVGQQDSQGKLEILGMGHAQSDGVVRGMVTNIDKTVVAIRQAVTKAEQNADIHINVVNVGIAGRHIQSAIHVGSITRERVDEEINVSDIERLAKDMHRMVMPPGSEIIHVMPQDYIVDYEGGIIDPVGMSGVRLEANFYIITAKTNAIQNVSKCVHRAGLVIDQLVLEPLASSLAVLSEEEKEAGVCLIDIGGGTIDIAIFHEGIIRHTAVLPFGGKVITQDIKQGCMVMENQAELLKTKFGRAIADQTSTNDVVTIPGLRNRPSKEVPVRTVATIIEARMSEMIELIKKEIIDSGYRNRLAGGLVITGGGATLKYIKQLFEYMTGIDTRIGYPSEYLGKHQDDAVKQPMYSTSVGLVLAGFKALDYREEYYRLSQKKPASTASQRTRPKNFFSSIIKKTKGLLLDEYPKT